MRRMCPVCPQEAPSLSSDVSSEGSGDFNPQGRDRTITEEITWRLSEAHRGWGGGVGWVCKRPWLWLYRKREFPPSSLNWSQATLPACVSFLPFSLDMASHPYSHKNLIIDEF